MNKIVIKKILSPLYKIRYGLIYVKGWIYIGSHCKVVGRKGILLNEACQIMPYSLLYTSGKGQIVFGKNVNIGMFSRIASINEIHIGNDVLTGPHVFIADYNHEYKDVSTPICSQGHTPANNKVSIGDGSWIGTNVVICGNVTIGKHAVIGAGAFVNKDIPDYCVAVGNPAKVVKRYNFDTHIWEKISIN